MCLQTIVNGGIILGVGVDRCRFGKEGITLGFVKQVQCSIEITRQGVNFCKVGLMLIGIDAVACSAIQENVSAEAAS